VWSATHAALHAWASPPRPGPDLGTFIASCLAAALGALLVTAAYVVGRRAPRKRFERHARAVLARISRMATARVADAAPGVVRIRGRVRALGGDPVVATVRRDGTRTALPFCVVDETGEVRVEGGAIELWDGVSADAELRAGDEVEVAGVLARRYEPSGELDGYRARRVEHVLVRNEEDPVHVVQRWRARR